MYLDMIIFVIILLIGVFYFRRFSSFVYLYVLSDMFLRLLYFLRINTGLIDLRRFLSYFPASLEAIYRRLNQPFHGILNWITFGLYICFFYYNVKDFLRRKKK